MHHRPDCLLVLGRFDELVPLDHCLRVSALICVRRDLVHPAPSLGPYGHCCLGVNRGVDFSCAVIAIFTMTGPKAAPTPSFLLLPGGFILRCVLFVTVIFLRRVHHVDVI